MVGCWTKSSTSLDGFLLTEVFTAVPKMMPYSMVYVQGTGTGAEILGSCHVWAPVRSAAVGESLVSDDVIGGRWVQHGTTKQLSIRT